MNKDFIGTYAMKQNQYEESLKHYTLRGYQTVNGNPAAGGSIDAAGPVIVDDWVFINSGYSQHGQMAGNVILAFSIK